MSAAPPSVANARRIGIGTVQFGTIYGITNLRGQVDRPTVTEILRVARDAGVELLDTAALYGEAERVLGEMALKVPGYSIITKTTTSAVGIDGVVERARQSHKILGGRPLHGLLVHSAPDLQSDNGPELWAALLRLRDEGLFAKIGISAYATDAPLDLARRYRPDIMQVPVSVLDQRLVRNGTLRAMKDCGVEIHARSVFLQGAMFLDPSDLPLGLRHVQPALSTFHRHLRDLGLTPAEAGMGYPLSIPEIDRVIVGMSSVDEAQQILDASANTRSDVAWESLAIDDEILLDPRLWASNERIMEAKGSGRPGQPFVLAILQARMSSSRLPGKVLKSILGRPMLGRHIDRLRRCSTIDRLVVATSVEKSDDAIAAFCAAEGVSCYRGPLHDVLARYEGAARENDPVDHVMRLTGDCPLADPAIIDRVARTHLAGQYDYTSNTFELNFPNGLDTEIMKRDVLRQAASEARDPYDREHVTPFIYRRPTRFRMGSVVNDANLGHMRWTVDTEADFRLVEAVYRALLPHNETFAYNDVLRFLVANPEVAAINTTNGQ
jgi:spore coat polysaccharide biosynthesis protein SpsF (cytidylyltransferase family)/aryl-alcohol dehydrogenase-like predicted oxidoreductase